MKKEEKSKGKTKVDSTEAQISVMYICQMMGCPTINQVHQVITERMGVDINKVGVRNALNSAKKRGLLSVNHVEDNETNNVVDAYSMKDVRFSSAPEIAHIKNVLPKLLTNESNMHIFEMLEGSHTEGERKGGKLPVIRDYVTYLIRFKTIVPMLGGQPFQKNGNDKETKLTFRRCGDQVWIPGNLWLKASIKRKLRQYNLNATMALYIEANDLFFFPKKPLIEVITMNPPTRDGGAGTGLTSCEALQPGEMLDFELTFPTTNGITEEVMRKILSTRFRMGTKSKDYGLCELVKFEKI